MIAAFTAQACLAGAIGLLIALSVIDLRVRLLPDKLVLPFALLAIVFHIITSFHYLAFFDMALGATLGAGLLYGIRCIANSIYKQDTLGLGDVKLMAAAGLWLGADGVLMALTLGAACGLLHGLGVALWQTIRNKAPVHLSTLEVPAGPGFAVGIMLMGLYKFSDIMKVMG